MLADSWAHAGDVQVTHAGRASVQSCLRLCHCPACASPCGTVLLRGGCQPQSGFVHWALLDV